MHVLVTGAGGFIGSHVAEALLASGHRVTGVDAFVPYYPRALKERNLEAALADPAYRFVELDLRTDPLAELFEEPLDAVVNEAAMPGLMMSWSDFDGYVSCNLLLVQRLLEACRENGVTRLLHASTSSVYGAEAVGDEDAPTRPVSPYGVTKLAAEYLIRAYAASFDIEAVILRYFSIYGPRQRPDMAFNRFIVAMAAGEPITVHGDGTQSRSSTYVGDCVRATVDALATAPSGEAYNIGGGEVVSVLDAIGILADVLGVTPDVRFEATRQGDQRHTRADVRKAEAAFGYRPSTSFAEGLRRQAEWQLGGRPPRRGGSPRAPSRGSRGRPRRRARRRRRWPG